MQSNVTTQKNTETVANILLDINAVKLNVENPFTWVSGIKSPIYCDNRVINSDVSARNEVLRCFVELIKYKFPDVEVIAGVATGGIPMGILIADKLNLPFVYVRQESKKHGMMKQIEGNYIAGQKTVLIEDHISTGGSSLIAYNALIDGGMNVLGLISIMTYGFEKAKNLFNQNNVCFDSLCNLDVVLSAAFDKGIINIDEKNSILSFRNKPESWGA
ncbi:MAG: orotate phosphoribosyltransferase [Bacteroidetes bacterium]|nr:orotate phosphoribosyltransferase [Bacteroidota bacterium]